MDQICKFTYFVKKYTLLSIFETLTLHDASTKRTPLQNDSHIDSGKYCEEKRRDPHPYPFPNCLFSLFSRVFETRAIVFSSVKKIDIAKEKLILLLAVCSKDNATVNGPFEVLI